MTAADLKPKQSIRRFDVFAEYRKQDQQTKDTPEDEAMGYGLWVAKVVASGHRGESKSRSGADDDKIMFVHGCPASDFDENA